jgi:hypothetical protein
MRRVLKVGHVVIGKKPTCNNPEELFQKCFSHCAVSDRRETYKPLCSSQEPSRATGAEGKSCSAPGLRLCLPDNLTYVNKILCCTAQPVRRPVRRTRGIRKGGISPLARRGTPQSSKPLPRLTFFPHRLANSLPTQPHLFLANPLPHYLQAFWKIRDSWHNLCYDNPHVEPRRQIPAPFPGQAPGALPVLRQLENRHQGPPSQETGNSSPLPGVFCPTPRKGILQILPSPRRDEKHLFPAMFGGTAYPIRCPVISIP